MKIIISFVRWKWNYSSGDPARTPSRDTFDWAAKTVNDRFERGVYQDGELAASKPQEDGKDLRGSSRHVANDSNEWKAVCTSPDFCRVGNSVVPFDSYATIGSQTLASRDVKAQGVPVYRVGDLHNGIVGDAGAHVVAGTSQGGGYVKFLSGQDNVKVNGLPVIRQDSQCLVNCNAAGIGGALGKVVTVEKGTQTQSEAGDGSDADAVPNAQLQALLDKAQDKRSFWQKTKDFGSSAWDSTKRIARASWDDFGNTGIGVLKGIGNLPSDLLNLGVLASKYSGGPLSPSVVSGMLERGAMEAYQAGNLAQANALAAQASQIMSSGYVGDIFELKGDAQQGGSFLSMLVPLGAAAKGLGTAGKVARGVKAADATADAVRAADVAADVARGAEVAGDAGTAARTAEAGKAAEAASDAKKGVHVKPPPTVKRNGYTYHLDEYGRVTKVEGDLVLNKGQGRNPSAQKNAGGADRLPDDQGGHYIGRRFDGPMDDFNHFAQNGNFNNSAYKKLENSWQKALESGKSVKVKITPQYIGTSLRPDKLIVNQLIDGVAQDPIRFVNKFGGM